MSKTQDKCDCDTPIEEETPMLHRDLARRRKSVDHYVVEANVTLISCDNVEFRVWDYELKAGSATFNDILNMGAETCKGSPIVLQLEEESRVVKVLLDIMRQPLAQICRTPDYWTFEEAETEHAAAEKYMLDRYMSLFQNRVARAAPKCPFQALVWAIGRNDCYIARAAIASFDEVNWLQLGPGKKKVECLPVYWTVEMIEAIGIKHYRQILRIVMTDLVGQKDAKLEMFERETTWRLIAADFSLHEDDE